MIDINKLRKLAKAATPGRGWYVELGDYIYGEKDVTDGEEEWQPVIAHTEDGEPVNFEGSVAAFIAAANPAAVLELLDRLEAAENDALEQARLNGIGAEKELALMAKLEAAEKEIRLLRAKVETMEKQEPVAWVRKLGLDLPSVVCVTDLKYRPSDTPESSYIPLYLAPGAQPAPSIPEGWMLVPVEPTEVMITAALGEFHMLNIRRVMACYDAMLAAAPGAKGE